MSIFSAIAGQSSAPTDTGQDALDAARQQEFLSALRQMASGNGPNLAGQMLQQQSQQNQAMAIGQAAAARGVNPALALRDAQLANVQAGQIAGQQAANARVQQQLGAVGTLGQSIDQARQQDIQKALGYAGFQNSTNLANAANEQNFLGSAASGAASFVNYLSGSKNPSGRSGVDSNGYSTPYSAGSDPGSGEGTPNAFGTTTTEDSTAPTGTGNSGDPGTSYAATGGEVKRTQIGNNPKLMMANGGTPTFTPPPDLANTPADPGYVNPYYHPTPDFAPDTTNWGIDNKPPNGIYVAQSHLTPSGSVFNYVPIGGSSPWRHVDDPNNYYTLDSHFHDAIVPQGGKPYDPNKGKNAPAISVPSEAPPPDLTGTLTPTGYMRPRIGGSPASNLASVPIGTSPFLPASAAVAHMAMAAGGEVNGPRSNAAKILKGMFSPPVPAKMADGGKVDALLSPGERYLPPQTAKEVAEGKKPAMKAGAKVPGKPKVPGAKNSYANDTVPAKLEEGGIVIPRSITQGPNAEKAAHDFVSAVLAKSRGLK